MVVERVEARACIRDPAEEVERIRTRLRNGDDSWARWLRELDRGEAVVANLEVAVHVRLRDGSRRSATADNHHLWLEVGTHPPLIEAQVEEVAAKDFSALAEHLRGLGGDVTADELSDMYVHVELADDLLAAADSADPSLRRRRHGAEQGLGTETGPHVVH